MCRGAAGSVKVGIGPVLALVCEGCARKAAKVGRLAERLTKFLNDVLPE